MVRNFILPPTKRPPPPSSQRISKDIKTSIELELEKELSSYKDAFATEAQFIEDPVGNMTVFSGGAGTGVTTFTSVSVSNGGTGIVIPSKTSVGTPMAKFEGKKPAPSASKPEPKKVENTPPVVKPATKRYTDSSLQPLKTGIDHLDNPAPLVHWAASAESKPVISKPVPPSNRSVR